MNCQTLREAIVDVARGAPVGPGSAAALEAHVQYCPSCAVYLARERDLSAGLRALAAATTTQISPEIERRLQSAFAKQHAKRGVGSRLGRSRWLRAAAIVIVAAGAFAWWLSNGAHRRNANPQIASAPAQPPNVIFAEGFVPLPIAAGLPEFESGEIIRIEIPVASLPSYGIEIVPDARRTPVQADLLVGQDGQARAIRLVRGANVDRTVTP